MSTIHIVVTLIAIAINSLSGAAAIARFKPFVSAMAQVNVPESWLIFPIGTLKTTGAVGLLLGLVAVPAIGTAAAIGLVLYFTCAVYTHVPAHDYSTQFGAAIGFLLIAAATLALSLPTVV